MKDADEGCVGCHAKEPREVILRLIPSAALVRDA